MPLSAGVSVVIVNWNRADLTNRCIAGVLAHIGIADFEIVVVDNGSDPADLATIADAYPGQPVSIVGLNRNCFFGEANNIGVERAAFDTVLLLNNDAFVPPGFLPPMLQALDMAHGAGAVGPKFIYPDGRVQEVGAFVRPDGWTVQHGKADGPAPLLADGGLHIVDYCSAACLLMRRDVFLRLGGFDPSFEPAYFEDVDLMLRLRSAGLFTYLCSDVAVVHEENATTATALQQEERTKVVVDSHAVFIARWGTYVAGRLFDEVAMPAFGFQDWQPPPALEGRPVVLLQGPGLVGPGAEWRQLIGMAGAFAEDCHVVFAADEACSRARLYTLAAQQGVRLGDVSVMRVEEVRARLIDPVLIVTAAMGREPVMESATDACLSRAQAYLAGASAPRHEC